MTDHRTSGAGTTPSRGRILIAGLRGSSGKTALTLGLIGALRRRGMPVTAFKKGPDYIDAAWHALATGRPCSCLDVYLMGAERVARHYAERLPDTGIAVIEGNRGVFDGVDSRGSYSTAELAKLLRCPVLLVIDATRLTGTAAALVAGVKAIDPDLDLRGVVLNMVAGERHRTVATAAIEQATGVPVVGAIPRLAALHTPERHLGLVTVDETPDPAARITEITAALDGRLDLPRILEIAASAPEIDRPAPEPAPAPPVRTVRIGVIRDSAFSFYYPENLEALERRGAELVPIRALDDPELPDLQALYIGGGFPETHGRLLAQNDRFRASLQKAAAGGLPIYAECGGAIYLGRRLLYRGEWLPLAGVLPVDFEFCDRPQGHGYTEWLVDRPNPFYPEGMVIRGHEFHYARVRDWDPSLSTVCAVRRGAGFPGGREGLRRGGTVAFFGHVHALACEEWAAGMIQAALNRP